MTIRVGLRALGVFAFATLFGVAATPALAQQTGRIEGRVLDAGNGLPIVNAQVFVVGTTMGTQTNQTGRFSIGNVPAGAQQVVARIIGYSSDSISVTVQAGQTATADFSLERQAAILQEVVTTGVSGATLKAKLPITVEKLSAEDIPVPAVNAASAIQGKVAGVTVVGASGRPGSEPSILLRAPTAINASGRSQDPLYIVDGIILAGGLADLDALDIESIEIVKGAAAASLYGSRAANGVVQITTRSGQSVGEDRTRYTVRSEYGQSQLEGDIGIAQNHVYALNASGTAFVDSDGNELDWTEEAIKRNLGEAYRTPSQRGTTAWNTFQDGVWPGQTYDHLESVFDPQPFMQSNLAVEGRSGRTNYHVSFANVQQGGVLVGMDGYERNNFRLNLDQGVRDDLQLSVRSFYSRSSEDGQIADGGGPLFALTRMPAGVDLFTRDPEGELLITPDLASENANPLYDLMNSDRSDKRQRFLGGANLRYTPLAWLDVDANVSYDRSTVDREQFNFIGYRTARASSVNEGFIFEDGWFEEAMNASLTGTVRWSFGDLATRTQLRYLYETEDFDYESASGSDLVAAGIRTLDAANTSTLDVNSTLQTTRSIGYFAITNFDYKDRYILDGLVRRDGSSLFGANERWQTYYRAAAAWRVSEEPFWEGLSSTLDEFKLRYSLGTAGGRPRWNAQYETYSVNNGTVSPQNLGNANLRPEFVIEQEAGIDMTILGRATLSVNRAETEARDQILQVPLAAYTGFRSQWRNAGTLESNTWEVSLDFPIMERESFDWSGRVLWDRTRQKITELNVPPYQFGTPQQGLENVFFAREGEVLGTFYGTRWATSCGDLPSGLTCSEFQVNDDGYLVWVGAGNSWTQGETNNLWGTTGPVIHGSPVNWGVPIASVDADGSTVLPLGNTTPDYNWSVSSTMNWRGITLYTLFDASVGADVYNLPRHWSYFENYSTDQDQAGKSPETRKPVGYYGTPGLYRGIGTANSHFVEDGSFVKLRELSVRYRLDGSLLGGVPLFRGAEGLAISVVGRNLVTWTDYSGFDPEVGKTGGDTGSAALARFDGFNYPNFRTITAAVEISF